MAQNIAHDLNPIDLPQRYLVLMRSIYRNTIRLVVYFAWIWPIAKFGAHISQETLRLVSVRQRYLSWKQAQLSINKASLAGLKLRSIRSKKYFLWLIKWYNLAYKAFCEFILWVMKQPSHFIDLALALYYIPRIKKLMRDYFIRHSFRTPLAQLRNVENHG